MSTSGPMGNNKIWKTFTFSPLTTSKIRVLSNASPDGVSRVTEIEAYGPTQSAVSGGLHWLVTDHLGTPRMIFDQTGELANMTRHDYLPFGEELFAPTGGRTTAMGYASADSVRQQFAGQERDIETMLDFSEARYFLSGQGRFTSPDPLLSSGKPAEPQGFNRYTYCINNPLKYVDPSGLMWGYRDFIDAEGKTFRSFRWFSNDSDPAKLYDDLGQKYERWTGGSIYLWADHGTWLDPESSKWKKFSYDRLTPEQRESLIAAQEEGRGFTTEQANLIERVRAIEIYQENKFRIELPATLAGGLAGGIGGFCRFTFGAAERAAARIPPVLFHYTSETSAALIQNSQLARSGVGSLVTF